VGDDLATTSADLGTLRAGTNGKREACLTERPLTLYLASTEKARMKRGIAELGASPGTHPLDG